jgi:FMNH2-dependent dimethyl sulfone monooxygenase
MNVQTPLAPPEIGPRDFPDSPLSQALRQPLLLGLFLPIHHGGWSISNLPRGTDWSFEYNARLTRQAEDLGFDLVFGVAQWPPKGGQGPARGDAGLDSFIATAALASVTRRILLIATLHVLYGPWHPVHLARFGATLDHISGGRWGLNVVTGHRAYEHELFGWSRIEHDRRYALADEFVGQLKRLWTEDDPISHESANGWRFKDAHITPRPRFGRPVLVNATGSEAGVGFAARHSDLVFIPSPTGGRIEDALDGLPPFVARLKAAARAEGREIRTILNPLVVLRETDAEAEAYAQAIVDHADHETIAGRARIDSDAHAWRGHTASDLRHSVGGAIGGNVQLVGSPETIAWQIGQLHAAGVDGVQLAFYDFEPDLALFGSRVLPLLQEAGLRLR